MSLREAGNLKNETFLKLYGTEKNGYKLKVVTMFSVYNSNVEKPKRDREDTNLVDYEKRMLNDEKTENNISRAKATIFEYAFCNNWDWFFTGTLDKKKYNREDLKKFNKDFSQWIRDQRKKHGTSFDFLLIPELHADGKSWHMHGFFAGIPPSELLQFRKGDKMSKAIADKVANGDEVYRWEAYQKKFGFSDLEPIRNPEAVSKYVSKYITKGLAGCVKEVGAHLYYCSKGLNKSKLIKKGYMGASIQPSYVGDYCSISWIDYSPEMLDYLVNSFVR